MQIKAGWLSCALLLGACGGPRTRAKRIEVRAPDDLKCATDQIEIVEYDNTKARARGCGKVASYMMKDCNGFAPKGICVVDLESVESQSESSE